jgi:hypothetical protein
VTVGSAALKSAGYIFGGKPLRIGELGWVSTLPNRSVELDKLSCASWTRWGEWLISGFRS